MLALATLSGCCFSVPESKSVKDISARLAEFKDPDVRAYHLTTALQFPDGVEFLRDALPKETDQVRRFVIQKSKCDPRILELMKPLPGVATVLGRATCTPGDPGSHPLRYEVLLAACRDTSNTDLKFRAELQEFISKQRRGGASFDEVLAACPPGAGRARMAAWAGKPISEEDADAAVKEKLGDQVMSQLDMNEPSHRDLLVKFATAGESRWGSSHQWDDFQSHAREMTALQIAALAKLLATPTAAVNGRKNAMDVFAILARNPQKTRAALPILEDKMATQSDPVERTILDASRVLLGDRTRTTTAAAGLEMPFQGSNVIEKSDLAQYAMILAGCQLGAMIDSVEKHKPLTSCPAPKPREP